MKLKSCPFKPCNGIGQLVKEFVPNEFYVYCLRCGQHTDIYAIEKTAIKAWDRRVK